MRDTIEARRAEFESAIRQQQQRLQEIVQAKASAEQNIERLIGALSVCNELLEGSVDEEAGEDEGEVKPKPIKKLAKKPA